MTSEINKTERADKKTITLALQGGGAHGAFTWGVLDRLLEDGRVRIEGISGASAGAINAAVLADGFEKGGAEGAREALDAFWSALSRFGAINPYHLPPYNPLGLNTSPFAFWFDILSLIASPYQLNPANINPLRDMLARMVDFDRLNRCRGIKLYVCATNVNTNHLRIFTGPEITLEVLEATSCLPQLYQAVEIDGEYYWDGGFMGNPILEPLVTDCAACDILIVQVNPIYRDDVPRTSLDIQDRVNEITFNASLMREIRSIAEVTRLVEEGVIEDPRYERTWFHAIPAAEEMRDLSLHSKYDTNSHFLNRLKDYGRREAEQWLAEQFEHVGRRSTLDFSPWQPARYSSGTPA